MIWTIFEIVFPVAALAAAGFFYAGFRAADVGAVNELNLNIFLPALIFLALARAGSGMGELGGYALAAAAIVLGSGLVAYPLLRLLRLPPRAVAPSMMFTNYGNLGLPLIALTFGESALSAAATMFVVGNALHVSVGFWILAGRVDWRLLVSPMLLASLAGLAVALADVDLPPPLLQPIEMASGVAIPLMLFALGARIRGVGWDDIRRVGWTALVCPASGLVMFFIVAPLIDLPPIGRGVLLLFAVLPPAALNYIFAEKFNAAPRLVASVVLVGNLASLLIIPPTLAVILSS